MADVVMAVAAVASVAMGAYSASQSGGSFKMPNVQSFQIPQSTMDALNAQISQNSQLGTAANAAAQQAIQQYGSGQLSAAYQGQYQQQYQQQLEQVKSHLASQGFDQNSTQYQNAMQNFQTWAASLYSTMLQNQLNDALKAAGVDQTAIANINSIISTQAGAVNQNNNAAIQSGELQVQQNQVNATNDAARGKALGNLASGLGGNVKTISNLFASKGSNGVGNLGTSVSGLADSGGSGTDITASAETI